MIAVGGKTYRGHILAVFYMTDAWPTSRIDHKNGIKSDNRWENLRPVTNRMNAENRRRGNRNSRHGYLGVTHEPRRLKWRATIHIGGKRRHIGRYDSPQEAHAAYLAAKRQLHTGCTI